MIPEELLEQAARRFQQLSDPTRLRLLSELHAHGAMSVTAIATATGVSMANTSQHLNRLAQAGVVSRERRGNSIFYAICDPSLDAMCDLVCQSLEARERT